MWDRKPSLLRENLCICEIPPDCELLHWSVVFVETAFLLLLPYSVWPFYPLLWRTPQLVFRSLLGGLDLYVAIDLLCLWE